MIHQVGIALAQGGDGGIFGVAAAAFEPLQDQHPVALVLADAAADRLQGLAQGTGGLALAFAGVDLDAIEAGGLVMAVPIDETPAVGAHLGVQIGQLHQLGRCAATGADHLHPRRFGRECARDLVGSEQAQIEHRVDLVEHHHRIEVAGDRPLGDIPAPLGLLAIEAGCLLGGEELAATGAHLIDQMGKALLQGFNGAVLVVGAAGPLEKAQQQHPGAFLFADAQPDGAQHHPQSRLAFALAIAVIDMQLAVVALLAAGGGTDADPPAGAPLWCLGAA